MRHYDDEDDPPRPRFADEADHDRVKARKVKRSSEKRDEDDIKYRAPFPVGGPITTMVMVGLVLLLVGLFFGHLLGVIHDPSRDLANWFTFVAQIAWIVGSLLISGALLITALRKNGISPAVRVGLIIAGVVVLTYMLRSIPDINAFLGWTGYPYSW